MSNTQLHDNKMETMPIPKLLFAMSLPMMISMLVQALYNVVDSMFVAKLNEDALTAVSLAFPVQILMISVSVGTGVGINALLSKRLGEKQYEQANVVARNGIYISILSGLVFALLGGFGADLFFHLQTKDERIIRYGTQYMRIVSIFSVGLFLQITLERFMQAIGKPIYNMITQSIGAIINIVLDPIMIFGLLGFPALGVAGAAIATVTGQIIAVLLSFFFFLTKGRELDANMRKFRPHGPTIKEIYRVGVPSIIMQAISSVMTFGMNNILMMFSSTAAAVFGVYFKLQNFIFMPVFGLTNGMIPIVAYNYGARKRARIVHTLRLSVIVAVIIMAIGTLLFQIFPELMLRKLFDASDTMVKIGVPALRIISICFVFAGFSIIISAGFQALGNGVYSLIVSVCRQLLVLLPCAYIFAKWIGLDMVWWSLPIAEIIALGLTVVLQIRISRQRLKPLDDAAGEGEEHETDLSGSESDCLCQAAESSVNG